MLSLNRQPNPTAKPNFKPFNSTVTSADEFTQLRRFIQLRMNSVRAFSEMCIRNPSVLQTAMQCRNEITLFILDLLIYYTRATSRFTVFEILKVEGQNSGVHWYNS